MSDLAFFHAFLAAMTLLGALVFVVLFWLPAGYGQHISTKWGPNIGNRTGWIVMEFPVVALFFYYWISSSRTFETVPLVFFLLFNLHYCQRTFVFPLLIRGTDRMPWSVILFGMLFNTANAYMQGTWIFFLAPDDLYTPAWLTTPQFLIGVLVFLAGFVINLHSDHIIRTLRKPGDTAFHIPRGGMFRYVTCANYFGELTEWVGWAILTLSWSGAVFALWTFANLGPRAATNHEWYLQEFGDAYPAERKRMIPLIW